MFRCVIYCFKRKLCPCISCIVNPFIKQKITLKKKVFLAYGKMIHVVMNHVIRKGINLIFFFFYQDFLSRTLTTHRTAWEGRGPFFIRLYHFHPLTNIQALTCNFACEMTVTYFQSQHLYLPDYYSMRFYHHIELPFD